MHTVHYCSTNRTPPPPPPEQGSVSQRVVNNHTIYINRSSMANCVLRKLAINRNPYWNGPQNCLYVCMWFIDLSISLLTDFFSFFVCLISCSRWAPSPAYKERAMKTFLMIAMRFVPHGWGSITFPITFLPTRVGPQLHYQRPLG